MKLLTQGDDFGYTKAVTLGIIDAIDNGVLRNTGIFTNMPAAVLAAEYIRNNDKACFGIDFNIVSGPSVCDPKDIPSLVDEEGQFIRSGVRVKDERFKTKEGRIAMFPYEEVYAEIRAQYDRFIELTGKKPGYLHGHSLPHENYNKAIQQISEEEGIPYSGDIREKYGFKSIHEVMMGPSFDPANVKKVFDPTDQLAKDPLGNVLKYADHLLSGEYATVGGHPGFVDEELMQLSTLSLERMKDHAMMVSPVFKKWIEDNGVELITYYDLY